MNILNPKFHELCKDILLNDNEIVGLGVNGFEDIEIILKSGRKLTFLTNSSEYIRIATYSKDGDIVDEICSFE
jgi:hypothetical protein